MDTYSQMVDWLINVLKKLLGFQQFFCIVLFSPFLISLNILTFETNNLYKRIDIFKNNLMYNRTWKAIYYGFHQGRTNQAKEIQVTT